MFSVSFSVSHFFIFLSLSFLFSIWSCFYHFHFSLIFFKISMFSYVFQIFFILVCFFLLDTFLHFLFFSTFFFIFLLGVRGAVTIPPEVNSNDFGVFRNYLADSNSIFAVAEFFLNDSNFWCVQSSITQNVSVHVHVLWLVCTHTIPFRMLWCP